jgi:hypothetical protein
VGKTINKVGEGQYFLVISNEISLLAGGNVEQVKRGGAWM